MKKKDFKASMKLVFDALRDLNCAFVVGHVYRDNDYIIKCLDRAVFKMGTVLAGRAFFWHCPKETKG